MTTTPKPSSRILTAVCPTMARIARAAGRWVIRLLWRSRARRSRSTSRRARRRRRSATSQPADARQSATESAITVTSTGSGFHIGRNTQASSQCRPQLAHACDDGADVFETAFRGHSPASRDSFAQCRSRGSPGVPDGECDRTHPAGARTSPDRGRHPAASGQAAQPAGARGQPQVPLEGRPRQPQALDQRPRPGPARRRQRSRGPAGRRLPPRRRRGHARRGLRSGPARVPARGRLGHAPRRPRRRTAAWSASASTPSGSSARASPATSRSCWPTPATRRSSSRPARPAGSTSGWMARRTMSPARS